MNRAASFIFTFSLLICAAGAAAQPLPKKSPSTWTTDEACSAVGEGRFDSPWRDACRGVWSVYASIPDGYVWHQDKDGTNKAAQRNEANANNVARRLKACGITAHISLSDWFDNFTPGLVVVHSVPHRDLAGARAELARAKGCGIAGYPKASPFQIAGRD